MANYKIGTGVADITDPAINQGMQGMSDPSQLVTGVGSFYASSVGLAFKSLV